MSLSGSAAEASLEINNRYRFALMAVPTARPIACPRRLRHWLAVVPGVGRKTAFHSGSSKYKILLEAGSIIAAPSNVS
jgi:hypothetical protein